MTDQYDPNGYTSYGGQPGSESHTPGSGQPASGYDGYGGYGNYGNYGNYGSYRQGYGQPGAPSPSYPGQPYPGQPYPGQPYPGPMSQPLYGKQAVFTQPPALKKSRRGLKIALTVGAIIVALGGLL